MWFFKVKQLKENPITWENLKDLNLFSEEQLWAESQHIFLKDFLEYSCLGTVVKNSPAHAGDARDMGLIPGSGRSLGGGNGNPLQYSCLENSMDREAWWATVHGVTRSWMWLSTHTHTHTHTHTQMLYTVVLVSAKWISYMCVSVCVSVCVCVCVYI